MKIVVVSFEPIIDPTTLATVAIFAGVAVFLLSDHDENSA